jgi:hypothetical protein
MAEIFSSTTRPPPTGTLAEVRHYWRETWPVAMDARMQPRRTTAEELFPHLALNRSPSPRTGNPRTSSSGVATAPARVAHSPARAGAFLARSSAPHSAPVEGRGARAVGPSPPGSMSAGRGSFFSEREAARGAQSPLGGKVW